MLSPSAALCDLAELAFPAQSSEARAIIREIGRCGGELPPLYQLARSVGLRSRVALNRVLERERLPPARQIGQWIRLMRWILECEDRRQSLAATSLCEGKDPAIRYRLVKRLTGYDWSVVGKAGLPWVVECLQARLGPRTLRRPASSSA